MRLPEGRLQESSRVRQDAETPDPSARVDDSSPAPQHPLQGLSAEGACVEFADVSRTFGAVRAVDQVSLTVNRGEFFTLLGPSGSGKTTLLHLLAGFEQPDAGEIRLDGVVVSGVPPFRRGIGVVFQSYALFPHLSVFENVAFPLRVRKIAKPEIVRQVSQALELVQLGDYGQRRIAQLSGGQQQRVALARAFVFGPRLLLMDEPLSALDAKLRKAMRAEIKSLQRKLGVTVVYVTHDQDEALALSDRVAVLRGGRIEQIASPQDLYERPANAFVADFIGDCNLIDAVVVGREGESLRLLAGSQHQLTASCTSPVQPDQRVQIAVRSEHLALNPPAKLSNMIHGTVLHVSYGGDHVLLMVDIGSGSAVSVKCGQRRDATPEIGAPVWIGWEIGRSLVLTS